MKLRIVALASMSTADIERWTDLRDRAITPYPCVDPRLLLPALRTREDAKDMRLLFIDDGPQTILVMPFVVDRMPGALHVPLLSTRDPFLLGESAWHYPLVDRRRAATAFEELFAGLRELELPSLVEFSQFPGDGPLWDAVGVAVERVRGRMLLRETVDFAFAGGGTRGTDAPPVDAAAGHTHAGTPHGGAAPPSFVLGHSAEQTRRRARQAHRLEAQAGTGLLLEDRSADPTALEQFMDLQNAGWKGDDARGGRGLRLTHLDRWFGEVATNYRTDDDLFVYAMTAGSDVVYMRAALRIGDAMFAYADAYDERFAEFSPGSLGRIASLNRILDGPAESFDPNMSSHYVESSKLYPDRRPHAKVLIATGGIAAASVVRAIPAARRVRESLRAVGRSRG